MAPLRRSVSPALERMIISSKSSVKSKSFTTMSGPTEGPSRIFFRLLSLFVGLLHLIRELDTGKNFMAAEKG